MLAWCHVWPSPLKVARSYIINVLTSIFSTHEKNMEYMFSVLIWKLMSKWFNFFITYASTCIFILHLCMILVFQIWLQYDGNAYANFKISMWIDYSNHATSNYGGCVSCSRWVSRSNSNKCHVPYWSCQCRLLKNLKVVCSKIMEVVDIVNSTTNCNSTVVLV